MTKRVHLQRIHIGAVCSTLNEPCSASTDSPILLELCECVKTGGLGSLTGEPWCDLLTV